MRCISALAGYRRARNASGFLLVLAIVVGSSDAAALERTEQLGSITAHLRVEPAEVALSGELEVRVQIEGPAGLRVRPIRRITVSRMWFLAEQPGPPTETPLDGNRVRWEQRFLLAPEQPGKEIALPIEPIQVKESESAKGWEEIKWGNPLAITVTTQIDTADLKEARDIRPIEQVPPAFSWQPWLLAGGGSVAGILAAVATVVMLRRLLRRPPTPVLPHDWAFGELARIQETGDGMAYLAKVSDVIRRYLEMRFALKARRQTTPEFLLDMRQSPQLSAEHQALLRDLLQQCDLAKFARTPFTPEQCRTTAAIARSLVEQTVPVPAGG